MLRRSRTSASAPADNAKRKAVGDRWPSPLGTAPCLLFGVAMAATFGSLWVVPGLGFEGWCVTPAPVWNGRVLNYLGVNLAVGDGEAGAPIGVRHVPGEKYW